MEEQIKQLNERLDRIEKNLGGLSNDIRLQATIRRAVVIGEHTSGKPTIVDANGRRYKLQTV